MLTWWTSADIISTVEFDHTGNYLATGDKGGRVVLFERNESVWNQISGLEFTSPPKCWWHLEKNMRVQISYRISISRARVWLPQVTRDRREDQQDQVVPTTKRLPLPTLDERQDYKVMEGVWEIAEGRRREQPFPWFDSRKSCGRWWRYSTHIKRSFQ